MLEHGAAYAKMGPVVFHCRSNLCSGYSHAWLHTPPVYPTLTSSKERRTVARSEPWGTTWDTTLQVLEYLGILFPGGLQARLEGARWFFGHGTERPGYFDRLFASTLTSHGISNSHPEAGVCL
jgi:hypothetical protein